MYRFPTLTNRSNRDILTRIVTKPIGKTVQLWRGLYARVARRVGCDASFVSRIANGHRRSRTIETILHREYRLMVAKTIRLKSK